MTQVLVVLQNAYTKGALAEGYHPSTWRRELLCSRSGRRLARALPDVGVSYTNSSRTLGDGPDSRHAADVGHLRRRIRQVQPDIILACGKVAEAAVAEVWSGSCVVIPHPASRSLTNELLDHASLYIEQGGCRVALRQRRHGVEFEHIP